MDSERKAFVKTDGRSSDQTASSADESGIKFGARKRKHRCSITMLNMWGTVSVGQANRSWTSMPKRERKCETRRVERYFIWSTRACISVEDAAPAIRCQFMELGNRSSAKVQSNYWIWNDSNYYYFADDLFERPASNFSTPRRASWQVVSKIVRVVCTAIIWHLGPVNIKLPFTENEMKKLVAQKLMLFHNVLGQ